MDSQFLVSYLAHFSYVGVFIVLTLSGYVIPIPEEVLLLLIGYIAGSGYMNVYGALGVSLLGILAGDNLIFWLATSSSTYIEKLRARLKQGTLLKYEELMRTHLGKTIFGSRFIVGLRFLGPFLAGSIQVPWNTFQVYNGLALIIYVPILVLLGYHFHNQVAVVIARVEVVRHAIALTIIVMIGVSISRFVRKRFFNQPS
jgi:membrane protein DedA with SNARE-associated domain